MPSQCHLWFNRPAKVKWRVQIMKQQIFSNLCTSRYSVSFPVVYSRTSWVCSSLEWRGHILNPCKSKREIIVLYISVMIVGKYFACSAVWKTTFMQEILWIKCRVVKWRYFVCCGSSFIFMWNHNAEAINENEIDSFVNSYELVSHNQILFTHGSWS
jgi:hypothetical protein